jgi:hypothetical protein
MYFAEFRLRNFVFCSSNIRHEIEGIFFPPFITSFYKLLVPVSVNLLVKFNVFYFRIFSKASIAKKMEYLDRA